MQNAILLWQIRPSVTPRPKGGGAPASLKKIWDLLHERTEYEKRSVKHILHGDFGRSASNRVRIIIVPKIMVLGFTETRPLG